MVRQVLEQQRVPEDQAARVARAQPPQRVVQAAAAALVQQAAVRGNLAQVVAQVLAPMVAVRVRAVLAPLVEQEGAERSQEQVVARAPALLGAAEGVGADSLQPIVLLTAGFAWEQASVSPLVGS